MFSAKIRERVSDNVVSSSNFEDIDPLQNPVQLNRNRMDFEFHWISMPVP